MFTSDPSNMMQKIMQMGAAGGTPSRDAMMSAIDPTDIQGRMAKLFAGASGDQSSVMHQVATNAAQFGPDASPAAPVATPFSGTFAQPTSSSPQPQQAETGPAPSTDPWSVQFEAMSHDPFGAFAQKPATGMY